MRQTDWLKALGCPRCHSQRLAMNALPSGGGPLPASGHVTCMQCNARYPITEHVLDLAQRGDSRRLTLAGWSNRLPFVPWGYEHIWRPRALRLLTGLPFPVAREIALVREWLAALPGELIVDLGSSTDLYARAIARSSSDWGIAGPTIVSIDLALGMLKAGQQYARREGIARIAHVRAPVERLPFGDATVDGLVCGGSLNEFLRMDVALCEARRVCAPTGRMVVMSLIAAGTRVGRAAQALVRASGIQFPTLDAFNATAQAAGWQCERQQVFGVAAFTLLRPAESQQA